MALSGSAFRIVGRLLDTGIDTATSEESGREYEAHRGSGPGQNQRSSAGLDRTEDLL